MPQAIDIVVNNGAATPVAKTFSLITPAAGDGGIAQWSLKEGPISAVFPTLTAMATRTGNKSRKLTVRFSLPSSFTDAVTGLTNIGPSALVTTTVSVPDAFPEALKNDMVAFSGNLITSALLKSMVKDAYPAT